MGGGILARLVIVSNRVPTPHERTAQAGGLAVALGEALRREECLWLGWSGEVVAAPAHAPRLTTRGRVTYATLDLDADSHARFYLGYANATLWPLFHYRLGLMSFDRAAEEGYRAANHRFAAALAPLLRADDLVWVHDYHFIPMASALRRLGVRNRIGFFLHIPFPASEALRTLPNHEQLVESLCDYDLVGVQTERDRSALVNHLEHEAGARIGADGRVFAFGRRLRIGAFPIGIDTQAFAELARRAASTLDTARLRDSLAGRALIIGVDRLDYSKGLKLRFDAFEALLQAHPEHRARVTYLQIAPISRGDVAEYRILRRELDQRAGRINGRFAEVDWTPVRYVNKAVPRARLAGYHRLSRIGFVTPMRDGMNLVAKEFVAAQDENDPGALVLSRFAGAAQELEAALIVNPMDVGRVAATLDRALTMPLVERQSRWRAMMAAVSRNDADAWRRSFLDALLEAQGDAAPRARTAIAAPR
jgi:trehalose 6-phosphate synthase